MKLNAPDYVILVVDDLDRAVRFYTETLGLSLGHRSGEYAQLDTGGYAPGALHPQRHGKHPPYASGGAESRRAGFEIGFKVANVDAAFNELVGRGAAV